VKAVTVVVVVAMADKRRRMKHARVGDVILKFVKRVKDFVGGMMN
jgi:hypothetical protein